MTREAEKIFEQSIAGEDFLDYIYEDFSFIDAIEIANDRESIFDE